MRRTMTDPAGHFRSPRTSSRRSPRRLPAHSAKRCGLARLLRWGRVLLEDEGGVVAAEAEAVAERDVDLESARLLGHAIECAARVGLFVVDRRGSDVFGDREG